MKIENQTQLLGILVISINGSGGKAKEANLQRNWLMLAAPGSPKAVCAQQPV